MTPVITSTSNKSVASATKLKKRGLREQYQRFLVEGAQATAEALAAGAVDTVFHVSGATGRVPEVVESARAAGVVVTQVSDSVMAHLTSAVTPQGLVAVARFVDVPADALPTTGAIPVLCSVRDPGNAGTILRSADAAGASGVAFTKDSVDVYNPKTVRASAGSLFHLPVVRDADAAELVGSLKDRGMQVLAADAHGEVPMYEADLTKPTAILLGNEAWGLREETWSLAHASVRVPIHGQAESLNLAAAAGLLLFEAARQTADRNADLAELIGASVHDLRLPLTAVKGFVATLAERWDQFPDEDRRDMVEAMQLDLERMAGLITLLVDNARINQGSPPKPGERHPVAATLGSLAELFRRSPDYPDLIVTGDAEATIGASRLQAIVIALCEGAMWWGQEGPIEVSIGKDSGRAIVELGRGGGGPSDGESVFSSAAGGGGRISLHLARRLAESAGGSLTAEAGSTTRFRLELPS